MVWSLEAMPEEGDKPARCGAHSCEIQDAAVVCLEMAGEHERLAGRWLYWSSPAVPDVSNNKAHGAPMKGLAEDERRDHPKARRESVKESEERARASVLISTSTL